MLIFLTGFMCSGKTTDGKTAAEKLNIPFLDLDEELERQSGISVTTFIETKGITAFRELESEILHNTPQLLQQVHPDLSHDINKPQAIIATGGGCILSQENREFLLQPNHAVIWLDLPFHLLMERSRLNSRPLLKALSEAEILRIYTERLPLYLATSTFRITALPVSEQIIALSKRYQSSN